MLFVPAIAAVSAVIVVIKEVHAVVLIREGRAWLRIAALRSTESAFISSVIKPNIPISLVVITQSSLGVATKIPKRDETRSITTDRGVRHIGKFFAAVMHADR